MVKQTNIEKFYDCIDKCADVLYDELKLDYLTSIFIVGEHLLEDDAPESISPEGQDVFFEEFEKIQEIEFNKEEIRKAIQLCILKGFKHRNIKNGDMTPDTIAFFMNFIVNNFFSKKDLVVLDPMVGTSNLLATLGNNTDNNCSFIGIDSSEDMIKISQIMMDLLDHKTQLYLQDTLVGIQESVDLIITDLPDIAVDNKYLPSLVIQQHMRNLKPDSPFIALIPNTFFDNASKEEIMELANIEGLIKLPDDIFKKGYEKSILILTRKGSISRSEFILVDLASLTDADEIHEATNKLKNWFKRR